MGDDCIPDLYSAGISKTIYALCICKVYSICLHLIFVYLVLRYLSVKAEMHLDIVSRKMRMLEIIILFPLLNVSNKDY